MESRKTVKKYWLIVILNLMQIVPIQTVHATIGISTRFIDVVLEYVEVGQIYNLRQLRNVPYTVKNRSSVPMDIEIEVMIPSKDELKPNFEAIPDPTWIQIIPKKIRAEANSTVFADLILQIPDDRAYVGKHYQAKIRAYSVNTGQFSVATQGFLRFSTGPGPETLKEEKKRTAMTTLDFDITPSDLLVEGVEPGKSFNVKKENRKKLKITNRADTPLKLKFSSVGVNKSQISDAYEPAPNPSWLKLKQTEYTIPANTIIDIDLIIEIPKEEIHYGKKYAFQIKTDISVGIELEYYNRLYVRVKDK